MERFSSRMLGGITPPYMKKVAKATRAYERTGKADPRVLRAERFVVPA